MTEFEHIVVLRAVRTKSIDTCIIKGDSGNPHSLFRQLDAPAIVQQVFSHLMTAMTTPSLVQVFHHFRIYTLQFYWANIIFIYPSFLLHEYVKQHQTE